MKTRNIIVATMLALSLQILAAPVIKTMAVPTTATNLYTLLPGGTQASYREITVQNKDATANLYLGSSSGMTSTVDSVKIPPGWSWTIRAYSNSLQAKSYWVLGDQASSTIVATFAGEYQ